MLGLIERIASFARQNEIALTLRLVNKAAAELLSSQEHKRVHASQPLPAHAYSSLPAETIQLLRFEQRRQLVCDAARSGSLQAVDGALAAMDLRPEGWLFMAAAGAPGLGPGLALALCRLLAARGWPMESAPASPHAPPGTLAAAAAAGNADVCEWLLAEGLCDWASKAVYAAAEGGHVSLVQRLLSLCPEQQKPSLYLGNFLIAAARGYELVALERLWDDWLGQRREQQQRQQQQEGQQEEVHDAGLAAGSMLGSDFMERRPDGFRCNFYASDIRLVLAAAAGSPTPCWLGKLDALLWRYYGAAGAARLAADRDALPRVLLAAMSAPDGLSRVRLLWEQRRWRQVETRGLKDMVAAAAAHGDAAAVRYLYEQPGAELQSVVARAGYDLVALAATHGHLQVLQLLASLGVRCSLFFFDRVVAAAAAGGHMHILRWMHEEPGLLSGEEVAGPGGAGAAHVGERGGGGGGGAAASTHHAGMLRANWVWRERVWPKAMEQGLLKGRVEVVRYAREQGAPLPPPVDAWILAARGQSVAVLEYLAECRLPVEEDPAEYGLPMTDASVYGPALAAGDRAVLRALARLGFRSVCGADAARLLVALLEDPGVPLSDLQWLLERQGGRGRAAAAAALLQPGPPDRQAASRWPQRP
ncbi:hypothetical protein HXX76_012415 [Chlamydomonas incerta]|uniref:Uncharacterized protein n=1 Tax=Chlamydomonas incerta TaxID=51695 RepID=A0A835VSD4_CHLIN|nr:hypothetical protein HXX76_012415 [Chlamydomonas incerta]|eukprot:KAG2427482.1 hypothetical protein HXX76_012415 [Chlamydomonas incerta]